jgi:hypothetical protein
MLANMARLRERWARQNKGTSSTAKTYASRANGALREFLRWSSAPDKYDPREKPKSSAPAKDKAKKTKATAAQPPAPVVQPLVHLDGLDELGGYAVQVLDGLAQLVDRDVVVRRRDAGWVGHVITACIRTR